MDSLYADYLNERQGISSIWDEHGFITYRITGKECFLVDMFVAVSARESGLGTKLVHQLAEIAKGAGCEVISANIHLELPGANVALKGAQSLGFEVERANGNVLLIALAIKEK